MNRVGVPAGRVLTVPEALELAQIKQREFLQAFDNVPGVDRGITLARCGFKLSGGDPAVSAPPPQLGEHTVEIPALPSAIATRRSVVFSRAARSKLRRSEMNHPRLKADPAVEASDLVSHQLVKYLEARGVEHVFGLCGHTNIAVLAELAKSSIRFINTRHEQVAAHMADGYARETPDRGGAHHLGPGLTNAATGVANAALDSIPMVVIAGDVPSHYYGKHPHQEVNTPTLRSTRSTDHL